MLTTDSLSNRVGEFPLATIHYGITPVQASEIEVFPIEATGIRFLDMTHVGDIAKLGGRKFPPVDVICGGSSYQDLSVTGHRQRLAGERSGLFMEQVRIIKETRDTDERRNASVHFV